MAIENSNQSQAEIVPVSPVFNADLVSASYDGTQDNRTMLDGTATIDGAGTLSYQWYVSYGYGGTPSEPEQVYNSGKNPTYRPPKILQSQDEAFRHGVEYQYFYVVATNTITYPLYPANNLYPANDLYPGETDATYTSSAQSNTATITVLTPAYPVFSMQPADVTLVQGARATLTAAATSERYTYLNYRWQTSADGVNWTDTGITGQSFTARPQTEGVTYYRVSATAVYANLQATTYSGAAKVTAISEVSAQRSVHFKICRLRFLNPDGSTAFAVDSNWRNRYSTAFIANGNISVQRQNGVRRTAEVTLDNTSGKFAYGINHLWFGQEVALDEGIMLPNGTGLYRQQGIFLLQTPKETVATNGTTVQFQLIDKWAYLDGTLGGNLETTYTAAPGSSIYGAISAMLAEDRGNGQPIDSVTPVYTTYYDGKTQELPDGTTALLTDTPYTLNVEPGTKASVILELASMLNAWVGYDASGALRIDPSQDDVLDSDKPIAWRFSEEETELLGMTYTSQNTDVYNDIIVVGEALEDGTQPAARAQDLDGASPVNIHMIGRKTKRIQAAGYGTQTMCRDRAVWELKRQSVMRNAVTVSCQQILQIDENQIITIVRTDKPGSPEERHLVLGFTRPLVGTENMTINCVSVNDMPTATVVNWNS